mmetsp:Transcript_58336/g.128005  ORF Transcript_58336/g.128005 Transcript_58336/m.128005 type:complete len:473 (-) Transcript_58336:52-1470(-)
MTQLASPCAEPARGPCAESAAAHPAKTTPHRALAGEKRKVKAACGVVAAPDALGSAASLARDRRGAVGALGDACANVLSPPSVTPTRRKCRGSPVRRSATSRACGHAEASAVPEKADASPSSGASGRRSRNGGRAERGACASPAQVAAGASPPQMPVTGLIGRMWKLDEKGSMVEPCEVDPDSMDFSPQMPLLGPTKRPCSAPTGSRPQRRLASMGAAGATLERRRPLRPVSAAVVGGAAAGDAAAGGAVAGGAAAGAPAGAAPLRRPASAAAIAGASHTAAAAAAAPPVSWPALEASKARAAAAMDRAHYLAGSHRRVAEEISEQAEELRRLALYEGLGGVRCRRVLARGEARVARVLTEHREHMSRERTELRTLSSLSRYIVDQELRCVGNAGATAAREAALGTSLVGKPHPEYAALLSRPAEWPAACIADDASAGAGAAGAAGAAAVATSAIGSGVGAQDADTQAKDEA